MAGRRATIRPRPLIRPMRALRGLGDTAADNPIPAGFSPAAFPAPVTGTFPVNSVQPPFNVIPVPAQAASSPATAAPAAFTLTSPSSWPAWMWLVVAAGAFVMFGKKGQ